MKKYIIYALIYLSGCVCAYNLSKKEVLRNQKVWTKKDRIDSLVICSVSYLSVFIITMIKYPNEPASW